MICFFCIWIARSIAATAGHSKQEGYKQPYGYVNVNFCGSLISMDLLLLWFYFIHLFSRNLWNHDVKKKDMPANFFRGTISTKPQRRYWKNLFRAAFSRSVCIFQQLWQWVFHCSLNIKYDCPYPLLCCNGGNVARDLLALLACR